MTDFRLSDEALTTIYKILKRGNDVELKKRNGKLEIVEIQRELKNKTSI